MGDLIELLHQHRPPVRARSIDPDRRQQGDGDDGADRGFRDDVADAQRLFGPRWQVAYRAGHLVFLVHGSQADRGDRGRPVLRVVRAEHQSSHRVHLRIALTVEGLQAIDPPHEFAASSQ